MQLAAAISERQLGRAISERTTRRVVPELNSETSTETVIPSKLCNHKHFRSLKRFIRRSAQVCVTHCV